MDGMDLSGLDLAGLSRDDLLAMMIDAAMIGAENAVFAAEDDADGRGRYAGPSTPPVPAATFADADGEGHWVTIDGTHVFIKGGKIEKGPADMVGKSPEQLGKPVEKDHGPLHPETHTKEGPARGAADAAEAYRKLGTKAPAFKAWFGDWEKDPANASKVVNKENEPQETHNIPGTGSVVAGEGGKPIVVYHGTARGGFDAFDKTKIGDDNLFGKGFYFTEDRSVAESYQNKDRPIPTVEPPLRQSDLARISNFIDQRGVNSGFYDNLWERCNGGWSPEGVAAHLADTIAAGGSRGEQASAVLDALGRKIKLANTETKAVYLNIRKPFDIDNPTPELAEAWTRSEGERIGWTAAQMKRNLQQARANPKGLFDDGLLKSERAHAWLQSQGFDGFTHVGGDRAGGGKHHRVWIAFEPAQIKAVDNRGTFDPKNTNIGFSADADNGRGRLSALFYYPDQPRDDHGRWTAGAGTGMARDYYRQQVREYAKKAGFPTRDEAAALADHLSKMTTKQLHELRKEHGLKASGPDKAALVSKLAERFALHRAKSPTIPSGHRPRPLPPVSAAAMQAIREKAAKDRAAAKSSTPPVTAPHPSGATIEPATAYDRRGWYAVRSPGGMVMKQFPTEREAKAYRDSLPARPALTPEDERGRLVTAADAAKNRLTAAEARAKDYPHRQDVLDELEAARMAAGSPGAYSPPVPPASVPVTAAARNTTVASTPPAHPLPPLSGSPAQIPIAGAIRTRILADAERHVRQREAANHPEAADDRAALDQLRQESRAGWWMDNRRRGVGDLLDEVYKRKVAAFAEDDDGRGRYVG